MIQGAIFDLDGTLLDSMPAWCTAGERYLRQQGYSPRADLWEICQSMTLSQSAEYYRREYNVQASVGEIIAGINRVMEVFYRQEAQPKGEIRRLLDQLQAQGIPMCVATLTDKHLVKAALERCGMAQYFCGIFTAAEVGKGKDSPLLYQTALSHLGTTKGKTPIFEDAQFAMRTAKADGFPVVAIYETVEPDQDKIRELCDCYLPDYGDLQPFFTFAAQL